MLFNSLPFLFFFPLVFVLYWFVFRFSLRWQNGWILLASYVFYGWWSVEFLAILMLSTVLDYLYGFGVAATNRRKAKLFLVLSICTNLGILGFFKYYHFFAEQIQNAFAAIGFEIHPIYLQFVLPVGISFYTFHGMSYVFDIYRGQQKPVRNPIDYAVFVSFFPLLVAGPIERARHLLPQVQKRRSFSYQQAIDGVKLIVWGLFKKVVIADTLAGSVDTIFLHSTDQNSMSLLFGVVAFSFQIYGDFSGYSDMAIGLAKLLGFELMSNFRFPYFSRNIAEFWKRWHISLSSWFRDYLYIPLGGSRGSKITTFRNIFLVFLLSGFWHGASWNFIAWGFVHACAFLPLFFLNRNRLNTEEIVASHRRLPSIKDAGKILLTFSFVSAGWIFFRSATLASAMDYFKGFGKDLIHLPVQFFTLGSYGLEIACIVLLLLLDWHLRRDERKLRLSTPLLLLLLLVLINVISYRYYQEVGMRGLIYFQF